MARKPYRVWTWQIDREGDVDALVAGFRERLEDRLEKLVDKAATGACRAFFKDISIFVSASERGVFLSAFSDDYSSKDMRLDELHGWEPYSVGPEDTLRFAVELERFAKHVRMEAERWKKDHGEH